MITKHTISDTTTLIGLSTDTKPLGGAVKNGSVFIEMNTGKIYFYNEAGNAWIEWGA